MTKPQIHVLLVEDDLVDRMACRRALAKDQNFEFVVSEAETGREGLQLAHTQKLNCVLLDYHLPDMSGLEFLVELRNDLGEIPVPVMMLTGSDNAAVAVEAMKSGAQDYLVKDANRQYLELLPTVIERVLRERRMIMEKKQVEENLVQAEAKYRFLVEQIPAITYTTALDAPAKLLYISPQIGQLGFPPEEWLADPEGLLKQIHPEDRQPVLKAILDVYESGEPMRCEYRLFTRGGEVRWFLNEASLVHQESGDPLFLQGILLDITEDKQVEEELYVHRRRLEERVADRTIQFEKRIEILDSANANLTRKLDECRQAERELRKYVNQIEDFYHNVPCICYSLDPDGVFVLVNDTGLSWLGRTREDVVGKMRFADLLTPASSMTFLESYQRFKVSGRLGDLQLEIAREDGTNLPVLLNGTAIKDSAGRLVMSHFMMFDTSESKRTEQSMTV